MLVIIICELRLIHTVHKRQKDQKDKIFFKNCKSVYIRVSHSYAAYTGKSTNYFLQTTYFTVHERCLQENKTKLCSLAQGISGASFRTYWKWTDWNSLKFSETDVTKKLMSQELKHPSSNCKKH